MSNPLNTLRSLLHPRGVAGPVRVRACKGGSAISYNASACRPAFLVALAIALCALAYTAAAAQAELGHGYTGLSIGSKGSGAGEMLLRAPIEGVVGSGVAVNATTHDVYVADTENDRIDEFEADGTFVRAWGWDVVAGGLGGFETCTPASLGCQAGSAGSGAGQLDSPEAIAVDNSGSASDPSKEDVYVTNTADKVVEKFSATGVFKGQITKGSGGTGFKELLGVAVDHEGKLWVYAGELGQNDGEIDSYSDAEPNKFEASVSSQTEPQVHPGFAIDSEGDFYVGDRERRTIAKLNGLGEVVNEEVGGYGPKTGIAVDPSSNDVYLDSTRVNEETKVSEAEIEDLAADGSEIQDFGSKQLADGGGSGLAVDSASGTVYVADSVSDDVIAFAQGALPEAPLTEAAEEVEAEATRETLKGELNPSGAKGALEYQFDYNTGGSCVGGESVPVPAGKVVEAEHFKVQLTATHLQPESEYTYCLVALDTYGETRGSEVGFTTPAAIAPEPTGLQASPIAANTATLHGLLNPNQKGDAGTYQFVYRQSSSECRYVLSPEELESIEKEIEAARSLGDQAKVSEDEAEIKADRAKEAENKYTPPGSVSGAQGQAVDAEISHLLSHLPYTFCLLVRTEAGGQGVLSAPETFTTLPASPTIVGESASNIDEIAATLEAEIVPEGAATTAHFEYLSQTQFEADGNTFGPGTEKTTESESIGSDDLTHHATPARIQGLTPGTTYHYRVVAENEVEAKAGTGKTFTTPAAVVAAAETCPNAKARAEQPYGLGLPDCRAYEIVSPLNTEGQDATESFGGSGPRAAVSGEAIIYSSAGTFASPAGTNFENQFISRRGPEGWSTKSVTPPEQQHETEAGGSAFLANDLTPELTEGVASSTAKLTPEAPARTSVEEREEGLYVDDFANDSYRYINGSFVNAGAGFRYPEGSSTDLTHVVFGETGAVSEWVNGDTVPVSVTNQGEAIGASVGGMTYESATSERSVWHAVSADGSRVYFTSPHSENEGMGQLYVRAHAEQPQSKLGSNKECLEPAQACTIEVSASQRTTPDTHGLQTARYWGASEDGSRVFFTSNAELTNDAYTGTADEAANLYEYDLETGKLADLTGKEADASGEGAAVQGVVQISEGGSYVYFVADGVLAPGASPGNCLPLNGEGEPQSPPGATCNLYVSHEGREPTFIATLAAHDEGDWHAGHYPGEGGPEQNTAVVNPSGTRLAFLSGEKLKTVNFPAGYDNTDANTSAPDNEVYLYDAETNMLECASCNPTGARPLGPSSLTTKKIGAEQLYRPRNLLEDGALFFDSSDALVPHAGHGRRNVYEYEHGHVYAISDVAGGYESFFMDASANGQDVFFGTADQLLPEDTGNNVVVYDAREDGGFPAAAVAPSCDNADSCKPPESPQPGTFAPPSSATFSGPGNPPSPPAVVKPKPKSLTRAQKLAKALKVCAKDKQKSKRAKCQKQAKQKYGPMKKKAKKSAVTNRRPH